MQFYVWMRQAGEGCGHSIGCGERLAKVNATTAVEAFSKVPAVLEHFGFGSDEEREPAECMLLQFEADLLPEVARYVSRHQRAKAKQERDDKLRELDRLKRELGVR